MNTHLTDEHLADLLAGEEPDSTAELHLQTCRACRGELASLQGAAAEFNAISFAWAQVEAPRRIHPPSQFERLLGRGGPVWAAGLTTALIAGIVSAHIGVPYNAGQPANPVVASTTVSLPAELAADNRLMQSINTELQYSSQPAVPVNELRVSARRTAQTRATALEN